MLDACFKTSPGDREHNEDAGLIWCSPEKEGDAAVIVADGLGGHGGGEVASSIAVQSFAALLAGKPKTDGRPFWKEYFKTCEAELEGEQRRRSDPNGIKTTVVAAIITALPGRSSKYRIIGVHVGDSRLYLFHRGRVRFQTLDHSVPQMLVDAREIRAKDIRNHPDRNRLLKVMGQSAEEVFYEEHPEMTAERGDALLLCTDGFWELITEKEMGHSLRKTLTASEWITRMEEIVLQNGMNRDMDNYSALAVRF